MQRIGYIGLGIMGAAMARNLMKAGFELRVWNRSPGKAKPLLAEGARWADSPRRLAEQVDVLCLNVTDTPDVEEVLLGPHGAARSETGRPVVIDHSTISPRATAEFARQLNERGFPFLDAPVTGGDIGARDGALSIMAGGPRETFDRCLPLLKAVGNRITHVGPHGAGQAMKACNQILCGLNLLGVCEALALARQEGLDLQTMIDVTASGAGGSWALANLGPRIARGDMEPGFMIDLINKDLAIVENEAQTGGLDIPGTRMVAAMFREAAQNGWGQNGTQALSQMVAARNGLRFEASPPAETDHE